MERELQVAPAQALAREKAMRRSAARRSMTRVPQPSSAYAGPRRRQPPLQHRLDHLRQKAPRAGQRHPTLVRPVDEPSEPRVVGQQLPQLSARESCRPRRSATSRRASPVSSTIVSFILCSLQGTTGLRVGPESLHS